MSIPNIDDENNPVKQETIFNFIIRKSINWKKPFYRVKLN